MGEILLIAVDWQLRALVRAQLLEEGYEVMALPALEFGLAHLACGGEQPRLVIVDTQGLQVEARTLAELWQLTREAPLILCGSASRRGDLAQDNLPPAQIMLRPFRVGDLVEQVRRTLVCPEGETAME